VRGGRRESMRGKARGRRGDVQEDGIYGVQERRGGVREEWEGGGRIGRRRGTVKTPGGENKRGVNWKGKGAGYVEDR